MKAGPGQMQALIAKAKADLFHASIPGETLLQAVANAITELRRLRQQDEDVRSILRRYGHSPNGKRLPDAVDEALRHARAGE